MQRNIVIVGIARTAIGSFGGGLKDLPFLAKLATTAVKAAVQRSGVDAVAVGRVVMGTVIPTEPSDACLSRVAAVGADIPKGAPAFNVNRLCGSSLQAIASAAQAVTQGATDIAVAGGAESMSRCAYLLPGARMGDGAMVE